MTKLRKNALVLWAIGIGIAMSAPALAANAVGPYYATPSWDQQLPASTRFIVLSNWGNGTEAVLDRETGLVWEQSPSTLTINWVGALQQCVQLSKGGRKGWRLPTIQDLASLIDPTVAPPGPTLPAGHPFSNVLTSVVYWSASSISVNANLAWDVVFASGSVGGGAKSGAALAWCVRGGPGVDPQ